MATSRTFAELAKRLKLRGFQVETGVEDAIQKAGLVVNQVLVVSTPVDTGRARNNYYTTIGAPSSTRVQDGEFDKSGAPSIARARDAVRRFMVGTVLFITNNIIYVPGLDRGRSAQAPAGMSKMAVAAGAALIRRTRVLK